MKMAMALEKLNTSVVSLVTLETSIKTMTKAIENQALVVGDLISTLEEALENAGDKDG
jgi:hypothetical protein